MQLLKFEQHLFLENLGCFLRDNGSGIHGENLTGVDVFQQKEAVSSIGDT